MNAMHVAMAGALAMASVSVWCARGDQPAAPGKAQTIEVRVRCEPGAIQGWIGGPYKKTYIASNANGWDPRGSPGSNDQVWYGGSPDGD